MNTAIAPGYRNSSHQKFSRPKLMLLIASACVFLLACKNAGSPASEAPTQTGQEAPAIRLTDLDGTPVDLQQFRGKTLFINFWATWCKPCLREMPSIQNAKQLLEKDGVVFLFASNDEVEEIKNFQQENTYDFRYLRIENAEEIGLEALPTTYIINPEGKLVFSESGYRQWDSHENVDIIRNTIKQP